MKAAQLKGNLTDSLTGKMAGLGEKLQIPRFGPVPAPVARAADPPPRR